MEKCKLSLQSVQHKSRHNKPSSKMHFCYFSIILNFILMLQAGKLVDNQTQLFGLRNTTKFKTCSDIKNIISTERLKELSHVIDFEKFDKIYRTRP
jgi:hypothetical protein